MGDECPREEDRGEWGDLGCHADVIVAVAQAGGDLEGVASGVGVG